MSVELFIECPTGHRTSETRFQPGTTVRIAGHVTEFWSIPAAFAPVDITIADGESESQHVHCNVVGNFWWDVDLPETTGSYTIRADAGHYGEASLDITITRAAVHTSFEVGVDPWEPFVGGAVKVTARILADNVPVQGVSVWFFLRAPSGATVSATNTTGSEGATYVAFQVLEAGQHWVNVKAPAVGAQKWATFIAAQPDQPGNTPEPTPEPPDSPTPEPSPEVDYGSLIALILPVMILGVMSSLLKEM